MNFKLKPGIFIQRSGTYAETGGPFEIIFVLKTRVDGRTGWIYLTILSESGQTTEVTIDDSPEWKLL